ncbi:MAG: 50S ribosomal protein L31 [Anaerolineae bacterium]|nr:50S ribosomal protein L31 [Anaerolineae bacterium]
MKEEIHPEFYPEAKVICACGNSWTVGSTQPEIRTDVCSECHPFYTGEQRMIDSGGQVERFLKKLERRKKKMAQIEQRKAKKTSPDLSIEALDIRTQAKNVLLEAGVETVGDALGMLEEGGGEALMNISGFGMKSLATLKKQLRARGFTLPGDEPAEDEATETEEESKAEAVA